jgi:hypothetical protein
MIGNATNPKIVAYDNQTINFSDDGKRLLKVNSVTYSSDIYEYLYKSNCVGDCIITYRKYLLN